MEILINGNNVIRINKLERGEKTDRQTETQSWLYTLRNRLNPKKRGGGPEIGSVLSNDFTLVYICVNFKTNQFGVGC